MKKFSTIIIALCAVCLLFVLGSKLYEKAYAEGCSHTYYTMRVTHVEQQGNDYMVFIRNEQDELYIHSCSK